MAPNVDRAPLTIGFQDGPARAGAGPHDTTFALMRSAQERGHRLLSFGHGRRCSIRVGRPRPACARWRSSTGRDTTWSSPRSSSRSRLDAVDAEDPGGRDLPPRPQLVEATGGRAPVCVNSPSGLRTANEKLWALHFPRYLATLVSRDLEQLQAFIDDAPDGAIVKPVDGRRRGRGAAPAGRSQRELGARAPHRPRAGMGGGPGTSRKRARATSGSCCWTASRWARSTARPARDREPGQHGGGWATGEDRAHPAGREICARLAPFLRREGLVFVGIDVIGDFLIEVNVHQPTGLAELARLDGGDPAGGSSPTWSASRPTGGTASLSRASTSGVGTGG